MKEILLVVQSIISVFVIAAVIVQVRGVGFGRVWGSGSTSFTRRGLEKLVFRATFVLVALFIIVAILQFFT